MSFGLKQGVEINTKSINMGNIKNPTVMCIVCIHRQQAASVAVASRRLTRCAPGRQGPLKVFCCVGASHLPRTVGAIPIYKQEFSKNNKNRICNQNSRCNCTLCTHTKETL